MAVPPRTTVAPAVAIEVPRTRCTVEIESWAKGGIPKVAVRVDDDDPAKAQELAVRTYLETIQTLEDAERQAFIRRKEKKDDDTPAEE